MHTFYPFCEDGTFLSNKITKNKKLLNFIDKIDFVISQDNFSYNFVKKFFNNNVLLIKQGINTKEVISKKINSDKFRI
jgi:hypothetical protein